MFETPIPPSEKGPTQEWAIAYVKSISGILKIVEMVVSLITFICAVVVPVAGFGWVDFVAITGFIYVVVSFVVHIINYFPGMKMAYIIELVVYAVYTLFFLIAALVAAGLAATQARGIGAAGAAAFFCFVALFVWAGDTVLQFLTWNRNRQDGPSAPPPSSVGGDDPSAAPTY